MARNDATVRIGAELDRTALNIVKKDINDLSKGVSSFNNNPIVSKNYTQPLGRITGAANEFTKSLEASNARVLAFGASAGAMFAVQKAMQELVKTTITLERQFKEDAHSSECALDKENYDWNNFDLIIDNSSGGTQEFIDEVAKSIRALEL